MDKEIQDGILTFDELLEDDYYKSEFERRVHQRLEEYSHSDVKGGKNNMEQEFKTQEGEEIKQETEGTANRPSEGSPAPAGDPAAEDTAAQKAEESKEAPSEPAREMSAEQYAEYNETLRRVSKTAHAALSERYNAFEDAEVKALVKKQVMEGIKPDISALSAEIVKKRIPAPSPAPVVQTEKKDETNDSAEVNALKAENALLKAGITPERVDAAAKLFIAEGGDLGKVKEFVEKYPEWHRQEGDVVFTKAPPVGGKTAPTPAGHPVLNDFEKKVLEARKKRGLD